MSRQAIAELLDRLDALKSRFDARALARKERLVEVLSERRLADAASLIRFHEILLFLRAYPHHRGMLRSADRILAGFAARVDRLRRAGQDLSAFEAPEVSGIAGTGLSALFTCAVARHLSAGHPGEVRIDWEG